MIGTTFYKNEKIFASCWSEWGEINNSKLKLCTEVDEGLIQVLGKDFGSGHSDFENKNTWSAYLARSKTMRL